MQLKYKIPLILFAVFLLLVGTFVAYVMFNSSKVRKEAQLETTKTIAQDNSNVVNAFMSERVAELKGLENNVSAMSNLSDKIRKESTEKLLKKLMNHPVVSNVYIKEAERTAKPYLTEPYKLKYPGETNERRIISLHIGATVMDLDLDILQKELFNNMQNKEMDAYVIFVSNEGLRVAHPNPDLLLAPIGNDLSSAEQNKLHDAIRKGENYVLTKESLHTGKISVHTYVPVQLKEFEKPWSIAYVISVSALRADELKMRHTIMAVFGTAIVFWFLFLLWLMSKVFKRLIHSIKLMGEMAKGEGDLTIRLIEDGNDEIGQMSIGLNRLIEKLHSTMKTTQQQAHFLFSASSTLSEFSTKLSHASENALEQSANASESTKITSENAKDIANKASKTSENSNELASTAEQMSMNMNSVAGAVEQLSTSFVQITSSANESRKVAREATEKSNAATEVMSKLGVAANEIGHVTEVIKEIADKTNLLALNATIEAASAGKAGKGFAVVAGEIKELANQSAKSADDIALRIESIQNGTDNAIEVINDVSSVIDEINASIDTIANNVGEQTKASNEIASNAEQANINARQAVRAISEIAQMAKISARNADSVARDTKNIMDSMALMYQDTQKSNVSAAELKETTNALKIVAERLDTVVSKFKI
jgi:methyl-accepting chemotaxis protein